MKLPMLLRSNVLGVIILSCGCGASEDKNIKVDSSAVIAPDVEEAPVSSSAVIAPDGVKAPPEPADGSLEVAFKDKKIEAHIEIHTVGARAPYSKLKYVKIENSSIAIKNRSESDLSISFIGRVSGDTRLRIVDKNGKTIAILDSSGYFYGHQIRVVTLGKGESAEDSIRFLWPIAEGTETLIPNADYEVIAEFKQGNKLFKSEPVPLELKPPKSE